MADDKSNSPSVITGKIIEAMIEKGMFSGPHEGALQRLTNAYKTIYKAVSDPNS